jgi:type IV pilus assembly protein PilN
MVRINLLPFKVSKKREAGKQQLVLFAVLLVAGIVGNVLYTQRRHADLVQKERTVAEKQEQVKRLDKIIGEVTSLKQQQQQLQEKLDVLDKLKAGRVGPVKMLDALAQITPRKLWLRSLVEKDGKLIFEGTAATNYEVSQFMEALEASPFFEGVELKKSESKPLEGYRVVDFSLYAIVRYSGQPPAAAAAQGDAPKAGAAATKAGG